MTLVMSKSHVAGKCYGKDVKYIYMFLCIKELFDSQIRQPLFKKKLKV
jgi:hypothetical protein